MKFVAYLNSKKSFFLNLSGGVYQDICIMNMLGYGVIGNTAVFGTVVLGSSPGSPAFSNMFSLYFDLYIPPLSLPSGHLRGFFASFVCMSLFCALWVQFIQCVCRRETLIAILV